MGIIQRVYYLLGPYVSREERQVGRFFAGLSEHSRLPRLKRRLLELIQHDVATINLWTEYRYKGYSYLKRSTRRALYAHLRHLNEDFEVFRATQNTDGIQAISYIHTLQPHAHPQPEQAALLHDLMAYFSGESGRFDYRASSSFGRLLRDPTKERLVGDCNQIVTLYLYLFSRYFDVSQLKLRILPEHVALHYAGIDIETTTGKWANYETHDGAKLMPVEEIVSINLLDTTDSYLDTHEVSAEDFLQSARFAYSLSHERDVVTHNLDVAYKKAANHMMQRHNYKQALKIAQASRDLELRTIVRTNAVAYYMQRNEFATARRFAAYSVKKDALIKQMWHDEGAYYYNQGKFHDALAAFKKYGDEMLVRRCYEQLFFVEQNQLPAHMAIEAIQAHRRTVKRMGEYARKSGNRQLIEHVAALRKHLQLGCAFDVRT